MGWAAGKVGPCFDEAFFIAQPVFTGRCGPYPRTSWSVLSLHKPLICEVGFLGSVLGETEALNDRALLRAK